MSRRGSLGPMTARVSRRGGRPSKGKRRPLMSRVPEDLAERVMKEAETSGLTCSDWIARVLAEKVGYDLVGHPSHEVPGDPSA